MNLSVIGPRVFVRPDKLPEMTESGLHIVHDRQQSVVQGTVVAVGDGPEFVQRAFRAGVRVAEQAVGADIIATDEPPKFEHIVSVGERVLFSPDKGEELIFERDVLISIREDDILAVID